MPVEDQAARLARFLRRHRQSLIAAWEVAPATTVLMTGIVMADWIRNIER